MSFAKEGYLERQFSPIDGFSPISTDRDHPTEIKGPSYVRYGQFLTIAVPKGDKWSYYNAYTLSCLGSTSNDVNADLGSDPGNTVQIDSERVEGRHLFVHPTRSLLHAVNRTSKETSKKSLDRLRAGVPTFIGPNHQDAKHFGERAAAYIVNNGDELALASGSSKTVGVAIGENGITIFNGKSETSQSYEQNEKREPLVVEIHLGESDATSTQFMQIQSDKPGDQGAIAIILYNDGLLSIVNQSTEHGMHVVKKAPRS